MDSYSDWIGLRISIHAPAKGATEHLFATPAPKQNFNPRSREGSDITIYRIAHRRSHFNPRSREGSDEIWQCKDGRSDISIHAPAKGATQSSLCRLLASSFQSTLPRRERRNFLSFPCSRGHFNPRSREGSDCKIAVFAKKIQVFQSTLPRRERLDQWRIYSAFLEFQSTLPRRERHLQGLQKYNICLISIHAPAKGATIKSFSHIASTKFQSTLPRRERPNANAFRVRRDLISIHAPAKGATGLIHTAYAALGDFNPRSREGSDSIY